MNVYEARSELRRMNRTDLLRLAQGQRVEKCLIGGKPCSLYFNYKGMNFCVSELIGQSCLMEKIERFDGSFENPDQISLRWVLP